MEQSLIGQKLSGYEVVERIGVGGMAEIYRAYDRPVDRFVAIKVLSRDYRDNPEFRERFSLEAKSIARLEHAHILPIYAYGEHEGRLYFVVRYMPAGSLAQKVKREGPLQLADAAEMLDGIASALDYAHAKGILHRDFKTENVLLDASDHAYVADFGLAKLLNSPSGNLTREFLPGTPEFMSPEQCLGEDDLTPASDQYALGIVLFQMITGNLPFWSSNPLALLQKHVNETPPSPSAVRPDLPKGAEQVIMKAMAKKPADRFPNCAALSESFNYSLGFNRLVDRFGSELGDRIDNALEKVQRKRKRPDQE